MAKKKSNYTNKNSIEFLINEISRLNPTVPIEDIEKAIRSDVSTSEMAINSENIAYTDVNPALFRLLKEKYTNPKKAMREEIEKYSRKIPYIKDKEVRLTKGIFNTGKISTNVLDSIYDSSKRVGIPFEEALGLAGRESTLGIGRGFKEGKPISPTELMSNWQQIQTIYNGQENIDRYNSIINQYNKGLPVSQEDVDFVEYFLDNSKKELDSTRPIEENPIDNALKYYKEGKYNKNDSRHTRMVKEDGRTLMSEPAIQEWAKSRNIFDDGGDLGIFDFKNTFTKGNINKMLKSGIGSGIGSTVGNIAGGAIAGGLESGAGKSISNIGGTIGGAIGAVNPVLGGIVSAASGVLGGLTNRMFGSKLNKENIAGIESANKGMNTLMVDSSNFDTIENQWGTQNFGSDFSRSDIGKDGWFSNKAKNKFKELQKQQGIARNRALTAFENAAESADTQSDLNILSNFAAYGGPLGIWGYGGGAIGYELAKENLGIREMKALNESKLTSLPNSFSSPELNTFAKGGRIHIKPENRGKFTEYCGGKVTSECIAKGKRSSDPAIRKRATFAANARKWKHADGGQLFTNGVTMIGNGGTHEQNPMEGVPMGIDPNGIPNLVEEGEVIFNDYVFSNRLNVPDAVREKYKLRGNKELTFADAAKQMQKESEERPNDPISKRGLESAMLRLQQAQETVREEKQASQEGREYGFGGKVLNGIIGLFNSDAAYNNAVMSAEADKLMGNPTASYEDYMFAHGGKLGNLFAGPGEKSQVMDRAKAKRQGYDVGSSLEDYLEDPVYENADDSKSDLSWLRYAPVVGAAIGLGQNLLSKPDYSNADAILAAAEKAGTYTPVGFDPIGNYLQYNPLDRNFYINKLNAQAGATRRAIMNTSSPARNAALLAADYNAQGRLGDLARQAEEYNLAQRQAVETFNRATNMANAEMGLKAAMANQEAALNAGRTRLSGTAQAMAMRDEIAARRGASMSANLTNLFDSLGNIGIDEMNRADRDFYIKHVMGANLPLEEYRRLYGLDAAKKEAKKRGYTDNEITKLFKNGGQLKKKRGGFTY